MTRPTRLLFGLSLTILILLGGMFACTRPQPTPTPSPPLTVTPPPVVTDTPEGPPSPTPPPLPPVVVDVRPAPGEEARPDTPIEIVFSMPIAPESARDAVSVQPEVPGTTEVVGPVLRFRPRTPFPHGQWITVRVKEQIRSVQGIPLMRPVSYRFVTQAPLEVSRHSPRKGEEAVPITATIRVAFNRAVAQLEETNTEQPLPEWFQIQPPVPGAVRWVGTSLLEFRPASAFRAATWYTVTITRPLSAVDGAPLTEPVTFTFRTIVPRVVKIAERPIDTPSYIPLIRPGYPITVTFSMPINRSSAEGRVRLIDHATGAPVPIALSWVSDTMLLIQPQAPLHMGGFYTVSIAQALEAKDGATLASAVAQPVRVIPPIRVVSVRPQDGSTNVTPGFITVQFTFEGAVDRSTLADAVSIVPEPTRVFTYFDAFRNEFLVDLDTTSRTTYTITLKGTIGDQFGHTLGKDVQVRFTTGDFPAAYQLVLPVDGAMFEAGLPITVPLRARNVPALTFNLYRLPTAQALEMITKEVGEWHNILPEALGTPMRTWDVILPEARNVWHEVDITLTTVQGELLPPGLYVLEAIASPQELANPVRRLLVVTPYNVLLKVTGQEALAWITNLRTGQPVTNVPVQFIVPSQERQTVVTDANGLARVNFARPISPWTPVVAVVAPDAPLGVASSEWEEGISRWNFRLPYAYGTPQSLVAHLITERPVYRPGQTIYWKLIVRQDEDETYALPPPNTQVRLSIQDPNGDIVYEQDLTLNEMGTASGRLPLASEAPLGFYTFWVEGAEMTTPTSVLVAAYRKPEFELNLEADPPEVVRGTPARVVTRARYFFGAAVANARVEYTVLEEPYTVRWTCPRSSCPPYRFDDVAWWEWDVLSEPGYPVAEGSGQTDAQGVFTITLPTTPAAEEGSRRWTVEVTLYDQSGQTISGRTHVVAHQAALYPGIAVDRRVLQVGHATEVSLLLVDTQGQPVPDRDVTLIAYRQLWRNVRKQDMDGVFRWVSEVEERPVFTTTVRVDDNGQGRATFTPPEPGSYRLRVVARDAQGRMARASSFIWVGGTEYVPWRRENNNRLLLVADKNTYRVGETARILIPSPYPGPAEALVTLERGRIRRAWRITLQTNNDVLTLPITPDMAPNVFVSVFIVQGGDAAEDGLPSFKLGYTELQVDIRERTLAVRAIPERETYRPRDTARFTLEVQDVNGQPVDAEVAVALVDKAVLTLFERPTPLAQVFYRQRGLAVRTAATLVQNVQRRLQQEEIGGKGGGGGPGGPPPTVREEFLDVAYWQPDLRTGPTGRARLTIPLPDNVTTWTLLVWAVDRTTRVGETSADILVTQPFLLQPVLPRFFTVGDEAPVGVMAHNLSDTPLRARVTMSITGGTLADPPVQEVTLAAGQSALLRWSVREITGESGPEGLVFTAFWQGVTDVSGVSDAVRITVPVRYPAPPEVRATAGMVPQDDTRLEVVSLPSGRTPAGGQLELSLDASLASSMLDSLTYLRSFPWECSEQTISRFLPNVVTWRALQRLGVQQPDLQEVLPDLVATAVQRLSQQQNPDGGWGWWPGEQSNPFITAYGLWALVEADRAGYTIAPAMMERAANFLFTWLRDVSPSEERWFNNRLAMVIFALATYDARYSPQPAQVFPDAVRLFERRDALDIYGNALLGLTFGTLAQVSPDVDQSNAARDYLQLILAEVERAAIVDPTGVHWEEETWDWWNMNNDIRTTAMVLLLLARHDPENPLAPNVVRWLMSQRRGDRWTHTQDTSWAVMALTTWMEVTGELQPDYSYTAWVNGTIWLQGTMTPAQVGRSLQSTLPLTALDAAKPNWIQVERARTAGQEGTGALYYRLQLVTYPPLETVTPVSRGIQVERWYTLDGETPITRAQVGDLITVHLRLIVSRGLHYVMVEDPLPAGVEPVDVRLLTTAQQAQGPTIERVSPASPTGWFWWYWIPTRSELRDDRAVFFQSYLAPGTYEVTYQVRASIPGIFTVGPAVARQMYAPEVYGHTGGTIFRVD